MKLLLSLLFISVTSFANHNFQIGEYAYNIDRDSAYVQVVGVEYGGTYLLRYLNGPLAGQMGGNWRAISLAKTYGCYNYFCVGNQAINNKRDYAYVTIVGIQYDGQFVLRFDTGTLQGQYGAQWDFDDLAKTQGCSYYFCVGETAINRDRDNAYVRIVGIEFSGRYVLYYLTGPLAGQTGGNWDYTSLIKTGYPYPQPMPPPQPNTPEARMN